MNFFLGLGVMHENQISVVASGGLKGLTRSLSQNVHGYASLLG